jgi:hypothetical protein
MYSLLWVAVLDYIVFLLACDWHDVKLPLHQHWRDKSKQVEAEVRQLQGVVTMS